MKNEDAKIIIGRKKTTIGCLAKHNVLLDNVPVATLENGGEVILHSTPGSHTISLQRGKTIDSALTIFIPEGQKETYLFAWYNATGLKMTQVQDNSTPQSVASQAGHTSYKGLTVCKKCGNQIAKNAKVCPHCGARKMSGCASAAIGVICVFTVLICIGIFASTSNSEAPQTNNPKQQQSSKEPSEQAIAISAKDLYDAYTANQVNADGLYLDKELMVTGTILDITQDVLTNAPCVKLAVGDALGVYSIECFFPKNTEETSVIAGFADGQVVTITGKCNGVAIANVQLSECHL